MKLSSGGKPGNFAYKINDKNYRLVVAPLHMEIVLETNLGIPKGVWQIDTGIDILPAYMQLIDCNGKPENYLEYGLFVYEYIYTQDDRIKLIVHANDDILIPKDTILAILTPILASHDAVDVTRL